MALLSLVGCETDAPTDSGPVDASIEPPFDGGQPDAGPADAGVLPDASRPDAGPSPDTLRILTLNLHCLSVEGTPYANNPERLAAVAEAVARERVAVLLLQEVCDDGRVDAVAALTAALEAAGAGSYDSHVVFAHVAWEGTPEEARESVAVMARGLSTQSALTHRDQAGLQRVAAAASVATELGEVRVMSVHLDHRDSVVRPAQAREAASVTLSEADPSLAAIVGGDFNARAGSPAYRALSSVGYVDASLEAEGRRIDHIFVHRGAPLSVVGSRQLFVDAPVSDHPGVLVELAPGTGDDVTVTRIIAEADPGLGRHLSVRGDAAPLSWALDWPMHDLGGSRWQFVSTEHSASFEIKALIDGSVWQSGPNVVVAAGTDVRFAPSF